MYEFKAEEWFTITGRGRVAVVDFQGTSEQWTPHFAGTVVLIDGKEYLIRATEMTLQYTSPQQPYKGRIGLLVSEVEA